MLLIEMYFTACCVVVSAACDEGCTALLMLELDANDVALYYFNMSVSTLMPWAYLDGVSERVASYRVSGHGARSTPRGVVS